MKKTISIVALVLAAVLMMSFLTACGNKVPAGTYKISDVKSDKADDQLMKVVEMYKDIVKLEVKDDGSAQLIVSFMGQSQTQDITFKDGKVSYDNEEGTYKVDGNKVTIESDGGSIVFEKE